MPISIRDSLHSTLCDVFFGNVSSNRDSYYYFIGNTVNWSPTDEVPDFVGSRTEEIQTRKDIIGLKKATSSDVAYGVRRIDWVASTPYDMWDSEISMVGQDFYVLTDDFNVYKCLDNNAGGLSTVKPTGTNFLSESYADGYTWKYMYSIPPALKNKFVLPERMPVFKSLLDRFYSNGGITDVTVLNGGTGYLSEPVVTISVAGIGPVTTLAVLRAIVSPIDGSIVDVKIEEPGAGYAGAVLTVNGNLGASGKYPGNATAMLTAVVFQGKIDRVLINDPGKDYSSDIRTTIAVQGDGTGAIFSPFIVDGSIVDVIIEDPGTGYTYIDLEVQGDGSGADLQASISLGDVSSQQAIVEQTALPGAIHAIKVVSGGTGYSNASVAIVGDGTGATATALISNGVITKITVTNIGANYTTAEVVVTGNGTGVVAYPIHAPRGGHGFDAVSELLTDSIILYSTINNDRLQSVKISNDYRQFGIIRNPKNFDDTAFARNTVLSACVKASLNSTTGLVKDDILEAADDNTSYRVIAISTPFVLLQPLNNTTVVVGDTLTKLGSPTPYNVTAFVNPEVDKFSGDLLYVNNQMSIDYSDEQPLVLKTVITL